MELHKFHEELIAKLGSDTRLRPFVCKGNPLDCEIMVIGINAASEMKKEFSSYFDAINGFDFDTWQNDYIKERECKNKKSKFSPTRNRLNRLSNKLAESKILETNVFCLPTKKASSLKKQDKTTFVIEFLLKSVKPKIILVHGKEAVENLSLIFGQNIERSKDFFTLKYEDHFEVSIIAINHLFNQPYQLLDDIAIMIKEKIEGNSFPTEKE